MIIVAGAGSGGLVAALAAADHGKEVLLLEVDRQAHVACNSARSTGMVLGAGTRLQKAAGIDDTWQYLLADVLRKNGGDCAPDVAEALCRNSGALVDWLVDVHGLPLTVVTDFRYPGHSHYHMHAMPNRTGRELVEGLWNEVHGTSRITVAEGVKLVGLGASSDGGVNRVHVRYVDGSDDWVDADGVVLATNGFGGRRDWVREYIPQMVGALYFGGPHSDGSGIEAALEVGASLSYMDAYQGHATVSADTGILVSYAVVMTGGILVNTLGDRFGDETRGYSELAEVVTRQPQGVAFAIFDHAAYSVARRFNDFRAVEAMGAVRVWGNLDDMGGWLGFQAEHWDKTLRSLDRYRQGRPDPWGRSDWGAPWQSPWYSVKVQGALLHTQGGLTVDGSAQVLSVGGTPIPGLYACGGAAAGISGHGAAGYLSGNGLLSAMGLGYLAAQRLAGGR